MTLGWSTVPGSIDYPVEPIINQLACQVYREGGFYLEDETSVPKASR